MRGSGTIFRAINHIMMIVLLLVFVLAGFGSISIAAAPPPNSQIPVDFTANALEHDDLAQVITASGDVVLIQGKRKLTADKVIYNLKTDQARAIGHVVLTQPDGEIYKADEAQLNSGMKDGFVKGLRGFLTDGSRFTAKNATRARGVILTLDDASYTPCEPCKSDPSRPPVWQIVADEVVHNKEEARISYKNARFELGGVPVAYMPYFSHPDGSVKRKSGFLTPKAGFSSSLGAMYAQDYYWNIAPDKDATIGLMVATDVAPAINGEYRQRFKDAELKASGSLTYSDYVDSNAGESIAQDADVRGHLFAEAKWDMNDKWRSGVNVNIATDDQYLNQYDISGEDLLENEIYAERFDDRDYASARMIAFQDLRTSTNKVDQPLVLPEVKANFMGDPNAALGGRWEVKTSALSLQREGGGQDVTRGTVETGWQRRFTQDIGLVSKMDITARGDAYYVNDRAGISVGDSRSGSATRGFTQANWESRYPVAKRFEKAQLVVEPILAVVAGTNASTRDSGIPNEDSQDVYLDSLNLFEPNRFPGYDRIEDRSRATYGLRTGLYGDNGDSGEVFIGQSRRFNHKNNPFPTGSGLSDKESDYVGYVTADIGKHLNANYRFQLEDTNMTSQRHEAELNIALGPVSIGSRYFYIRGQEDENGDKVASREQVRGGARVRLHENWAMHASAQYELATPDEGLRSATYGIDYLGQCITLSAIGERTLTNDSSGDDDTKIMFRIGLKNLGEFQTSAINIGSSDKNKTTNGTTSDVIEE